MLFNDTPALEGLAAIADAHARFGTTGMLPTLISDDLSVVDTAMRAVETAVANALPGILGIHIEGPFLSVARKGIHDAAKFRVLDADAKALLKSLKAGKTLVTLAPETCTPEDIAELADAGIIVAAGHTNAGYDEMRTALDAGVTGFTHLFNAMSPFQHRTPGVTGAALDHAESFCGLILDGYHLHPAAARIALRCKGPSRLMLVTDAMPPVGSPQSVFRLNGREIHVKAGKCVGADGTLAGSALTMIDAVRYAINVVGVDLVTAATMAAETPATFLGLEGMTGRLEPGHRADLVWLGHDLEVRGVWRRGQLLRTDSVVAAA